MTFEGITLLNCDCMDYMRDLPDNAFDLAIVDPPYGIGEDGSNNHTRSKLTKSKSYKPFSGNDKEPPATEYFIQLRRVSKNQIVWGANHFIDRMPIASSCWVVWDKVNGENDFADCELAHTSFNSAVRMFQFMWNGMMQGSPDDGRKHQGNKRLNEHRIHPTQKPVALYRWLLDNYATPGQRILDTHLGSGSSAIAAHQLGFEFVGMELDPDYYAAAVKRFKQNTKQLAMPFTKEKA